MHFYWTDAPSESIENPFQEQILSFNQFVLIEFVFIVYLSISQHVVELARVRETLNKCIVNGCERLRNIHMLTTLNILFSTRDGGNGMLGYPF